jgi:hypothetical protein
LQYYNDTIQFQSTLAYLKNPPTSYQQLAVDFVGGLNQLQQQINSGSFANQYVSPHLKIYLGSSTSNISREHFSSYSPLSKYVSGATIPTPPPKK